MGNHIAASVLDSTLDKSENRNSTLFFFICIFALSGFSGLIYESIWTHYLKLFLGHSSYAQVLVLGIFMGGMALGASLAAKFSASWKNLILWYGIAEGIICLFGICFHVLFINVESLAFGTIFPALGSPSLVQAAKWTIGALLILPQSILLGATFPLLAAGLLRKYSDKTGRTLATLYFINSLGAAVGILANAFWLIPTLGLPGAVLTAGLINILIAIMVYYLSKGDNYPAAVSETANKNTSPLRNRMPLLLWVAAFTGLASFMYEIAWIRMLSMVLGGSTNSFEIMLAAFILGLALGSLIIKKYISRIENPLVTLGTIQITMGLLAALTIPMYNQTFNFMAFVIEALNTTDSGYILYSVFSLAISLIVMLPATICAGTTLPLVTHILLSNGSSDKTIGKVYAFNTLGGIVGIALAVQIVMPIAGLKWVIIGGALIDVCLGMYLLSYNRDFLFKSGMGKVVLATLAGFALALPFYSLNTEKMASGVFRYGSSQTESEVVFHKDGKTSTVAIIQAGNSRIILNNGKPDAGVVIHSLTTNHTESKPELAAATDIVDKNIKSSAKQRVLSGDQSTMVLLGTLPYIYKPDAEHIANIGLGSGVTTHTLLHKPEIVRLDTIEIEQAVVDAATWFRPNVDNLFTDNRSHMHVEDAKTYFATSGQKYDVVVSEPPNPWVSGVAGLFTIEFYHDIKRYLNDDGVLVQWIHLYEISPELIATVYAALSQQFNYIHLYKISDGDVAFVAGQSPLQANYQVPFKYKGFVEQLSEVSILNDEDIAFRKLGNKKKLDMFFAPFAQNANSDYFPVLDIGAAKTRFKKSNAGSIFQLHQSLGLELLSSDIRTYTANLTADSFTKETQHAIDTKLFHSRLKELISGGKTFLFPEGRANQTAEKLYQIISNCTSARTDIDRKQGTKQFIEAMIWAYPYSTNEDFRSTLESAETCDNVLTTAGYSWIKVNKSWLAKDFRSVISLSDQLLTSTNNPRANHHILLMNMTSRAALGYWDGYEQHESLLTAKDRRDYELAALFYHAKLNSNITPGQTTLSFAQETDQQ